MTWGALHTELASKYGIVCSYAVANGRILRDPSRTLGGYGIRDGSRIYLVYKAKPPSLDLSGYGLITYISKEEEPASQVY